MIFKNFKFGKSKEHKEEKALSSEDTVKPIAELEEQLKNRTNNLKQTEQKLIKLSDKVDGIAEVEETQVAPHGPIEELSIEPEDSLDGVDSDQEVGDTIDDFKEEEGEEEIKLTEVSAESKPAPTTENGTDTPSGEKQAKGSYDSDSLKALFSHVDEDENPLANLINSLPDVTIDELEEDLKEIKDIIRDWQQK